MANLLGFQDQIENGPLHFGGRATIQLSQQSHIFLHRESRLQRRLGSRLLGHTCARARLVPPGRATQDLRRTPCRISTSTTIPASNAYQTSSLKAIPRPTACVSSFSSMQRLNLRPFEWPFSTDATQLS